jgi:hypothetical protein
VWGGWRLDGKTGVIATPFDRIGAGENYMYYDYTGYTKDTSNQAMQRSKGRHRVHTFKQSAAYRGPSHTYSKAFLRTEFLNTISQSRLQVGVQIRGTSSDQRCSATMLSHTI